MEIVPLGPLEKVSEDRFPVLCQICFHERGREVEIETKELGLWHRKLYHPWIADYMKNYGK